MQEQVDREAIAVTLKASKLTAKGLAKALMKHNVPTSTIPISSTIMDNCENRIEVGLDYQIHIDLNIDLKHFNIQFDFCSYKQGKSA